MTPREMNSGVQFTVDALNQVTAVVVQPELWRKILAELADSQERELAAMLLERAPHKPLDFSALGLARSNEDWA